MDKFLRRFMGKSTTNVTNANAPINGYGYLDDDEEEYYEEEEE